MFQANRTNDEADSFVTKIITQLYDYTITNGVYLRKN